MQNDLISRSALIEEIKAEIENLTKEKRDYSERGIYHNMHMMGERIKGAKSVLKIVDNQLTAYNVEKVMADAEEFANSEVCYQHEGCPYRDNPEVKCENCGALGVVKIIRNGGKE